MRAFHQIFLLPAALTAAAAVIAGALLGWPVALALLALTALEIAAAADSSVPMAGVAGRVDQRARRLFLAVGLVAGVIAMRLLLPPLAVATEVGDAGVALQHAVTEPRTFAQELLAVRPLIAGFGAAFVWLVFAEYLFNTDRARRRPWLGRPEAMLARVKAPRLAAYSTAVLGTLIASVAAGRDLAPAIAFGGALGIGAYVVSQALAAWARRRPGALPAHIHAATVIFERALVIFLVFEILDGLPALGANTVLPAPVLQALIAGTAVAIGAVLLGRLTSSVVAADGLGRLRHLRAGAAYVLGTLSVLLWTSVVVPVPSTIATWFGSAIIAAAVLSSLRPRVRLRARRVARLRDLGGAAPSASG